MSITLRKRAGVKGISKLYLDYNFHGKRKCETLELFIIDKPTLPHEREANKQAKIMGEQIKEQRLLDY